MGGEVVPGVVRDHVRSGRAGYVSSVGEGSRVGRSQADATVSTSTSTALRVLSVLLATGAMVCLGFAIAGMINHRQTPVTGYLLRVGALACFGAAVVLNVIAH
jgi:hypothetical protein